MEKITKEYLKKINFVPAEEITQEALFEMFIWNTANEGHDYWAENHCGDFTDEARATVKEMHRVYYSQPRRNRGTLPLSVRLASLR